MRVYPDTSDLINLLERDTAGISFDDFRSILERRGHTIVLSFQTICELIAPLWEPRSSSVITRTMNRLEELRHEWIDLVRLPNLEVREALRSTKTGTPYVPPSPYVANYLATVINAPDLLKVALHYPLSEIAFDLWRSGAFDPRAQRARHVAAYRKLIEEDRKLVSGMSEKTKARRGLFARRTVEKVKQFKLHDPEDQKNDALFEACAKRILQEAELCPASKLVFSTFHSLIDNLGDKLQDSDLGDLTHVHAVPYVDYFSTDRRIGAYITMASKSLAMKYHEKLFPNIKSLIAIL